MLRSRSARTALWAYIAVVQVSEGMHMLWRRKKLLVGNAILAMSLIAGIQFPAAAANTSTRWQRTPVATGVANISWLSCKSSTSCVAFNGSIVGAEISGAWGHATSVPIAPSHARIAAIACWSPGNCAVGGSQSGQAFVVNEHDGAWGTPQLIAGAAPYTVTYQGDISATYTSSITAISCTSAASCTAAGNFTVSINTNTFVYAGSGFSTTETGGAWSAANTLSIDGVTAIVCSSSVACTVSGFITTFQIVIEYPVITNVAAVDSEVAGGWQSAVEVSGLTKLGGKFGWIDSQPSSLSCTSHGNCTVVGLDVYAPNFDGNPVSLLGEKSFAFVSREVNGIWGAARELAALTESPIVACSAASQCVAIDARDAYVEHSGTWGSSRHFSVSGHKLVLSDASCEPRGPCVVVGSAGSDGYAVTDSTGTWSKPDRLGGLRRASIVSCPLANSCTAAGGSLAIRQIR